MKAHHILLVLLTTVFFPPSLHAQSANELAYWQARAKRGKKVRN